MKFPRVVPTIYVTFVLQILIIVSAKQKFEVVPPAYQEVSSGDNVLLHCKVQDKNGQCLWQKDGKPVGMYPDKYEPTGGRNGDCSIMIKRASLAYDDGFWECQVTSGNFEQEDALTSLPSRLLVRVKPRNPRLEYEDTILNNTLTLREGQEVTISCVSRYGNPPALIKWYINDEEVEPVREQTNATEVDSPKTWVAHSLLRIRGRREYYGRMIRCITIHPSSPVAATAESQLNILYSPEVKFELSPPWLANVLEDSVSFVSLKCIADANPSATIEWLKDTTPIIVAEDLLPMKNRTYNDSTTTISEIRFEPVWRNAAGLYTCKAVNVIGESPPANYELNVQFAPQPMWLETMNENGTTVEIKETVHLGQNVEVFECPEFEGNPTPHYEWVQLHGGIIENQTCLESFGRRLRLVNVTWSDEGVYQCIAFNMINGTKRQTPSEVHYSLFVTGPPEIQTKPPSSGDKKGFYESIAWAGESVHQLKSRFCSQPPPHLVAWQWGSSHIRAGESIHPKYEALSLEPIVKDKLIAHCYWAKLNIKNLQKTDARIYTLLVESEKGKDSTNIKLIIRDPTETGVITAAATIGLLVILLVASIGIYTFLKMKRKRYKHEDEEGSIAADAFYGNNASMEDQKTKTSQSKKATQDCSLYENQLRKQVETMSPEALKVRRAPVVLQPPTMV